MARTFFEGQSGQTGTSTDGSAAGTKSSLTFKAEGADILTLPGDQFIADATILRDGADLHLQSPDGAMIVVEGYFTADPAPTLTADGGSLLTPALVNSFVQQAGPLQYASANTATDESPVGHVSEVSGSATITRADGAQQTITTGTPVYQGDIVETSNGGAVNIVFGDDSSFAVSENARLAIDEYVYDPGTDAGAQGFSLLRGVFVYTSGLIGRADPDDVMIKTPVGSIGIRGTIIAGTIDPAAESTITVVEGAIVIHNATGEATLSQQYETVVLSGYESPIREVGVLDQQTMQENFNVLRTVSPDFFVGISQSATDSAPGAPEGTAPSATETPSEASPNSQSSGETQEPSPQTDTQGDPSSESPTETQTQSDKVLQETKADINKTMANADSKVDAAIDHAPAKAAPPATVSAPSTATSAASTQPSYVPKQAQAAQPKAEAPPTTDPGPGTVTPPPVTPPPTTPSYMGAHSASLSFDAGTSFRALKDVLTVDTAGLNTASLMFHVTALGAGSALLMNGMEVAVGGTPTSYSFSYQDYLDGKIMLAYYGDNDLSTSDITLSLKDGSTTLESNYRFTMDLPFTNDETDFGYIIGTSNNSVYTDQTLVYIWSSTTHLIESSDAANKFYVADTHHANSQLGTSQAIDLIFRDTHDVTAYGTENNDTFRTDVNATNITIFGAEGADYFHVNDGTTNSTFFGGSGDDFFTIRDISGNNEVTNNTLFGGEGGDTFRLENGAVGNTLHGGDGGDIFQFEAGSSNNTAHGDAGKDMFEVYAGANGNQLRGGAGDDDFYVSGGSTNNVIDGGSGLDKLFVRGEAANLDFSGLISGIEEITLGMSNPGDTPSSYNNQTITLRLEDIFQLLLESDAQDGSGNNMLKITSVVAGNTLQIDTGTDSDSDTFYNIFTFADSNVTEGWSIITNDSNGTTTLAHGGETYTLLIDNNVALTDMVA